MNPIVLNNTGGRSSLANGGNEDYASSLYDSLPESARKYWSPRTTQHFKDIVHRPSCGELAWRTINLIRLYPFCRMRYLNSNECCTAVVDGEHRVYVGPGFQFVVGITDKMGETVAIGDNIDFGPLKIIFVKPGTLQYASFNDTGRPLLLGPGLHYFNDLQLTIGNVIEMSFGVENKVLPCDSRGAFSFIFIKAGTAGLVLGVDGSLRALDPGLHFIQSPESLKTFVSIQQNHFTFGTREAGQNFLTADNIELHINATLFYRVSDPVTLFTARISDEKALHETLHSQALSTLLTIIRSEAFQGIGKRQHVRNIQRDLNSDMASGVDGAGTTSSNGDTIPLATAYPSPSPSAPLAPSSSDPKTSTPLESITLGFQSIIHDAEPQFKAMMQTNFATSGIEIQSLRIEQIEFADKAYQKQVSEFALTNTKLQSQQQTISAQRALQVAEAERESATLLIRKKAEADSKLLMTEADNQIKINTAKAEAEQNIILAESKAAATLKIGEAELQIQERANAMPNASLRIWTDAQKATFSNVSKIVYTDQQSMLLKPYLAMPDFGNGQQPSL